MGMDADLLVALKALSDASRLRILGVVTEGKPISAADLANRLSLRPGTVVHHLNRLREGRLAKPKPRWSSVCYSLRF